MNICTNVTEFDFKFLLSHSVHSSKTNAKGIYKGYDENMKYNSIKLYIIKLMNYDFCARLLAR